MGEMGDLSLGAPALGDVVVSGDPAAIRFGPAGDGNDAAVLEFKFRRAGLTAGDGTLQPVDVFVRIVRE